MLDLDAYLERIGLRGSPTIARVHRAHAVSTSENLDPHRGVPVSLRFALHGFALGADGRLVLAVDR